MYKDVEIPFPEAWSDTPDPYMDRFTDQEWWLNEFKPNLQEWLRIYYAMIDNLDWNLGRLMTALDELGLRDNTIVVLTTDHGEMFGAHGRTQKMIFYEEAACVPFMMRWPGHIEANSTSDVCLNTPDIMPSLLLLMDLPIPDEVEGVNLSHCALGQDGPEPKAALIQGMGDIRTSGKMVTNGVPCAIRNSRMRSIGLTAVNYSSIMSLIRCNSTISSQSLSIRMCCKNLEQC